MSWKNLSIQWKIVALCGLFVMLLGGVLFNSYRLDSIQRYDSVVINMAGRQRMLTQAMTKAAMVYRYSTRIGRLEQAEAAREECETAMGQFDAALKALISGGAVPLGGGRFTEPLPGCSDPAILAQLDKVDREWEPFRRNLARVMASGAAGGEPSDGLQYVLDRNTVLRGEMDKAVKMFEESSKSKLAAGRKSALAFFLAELMIAGFTFWSIRRWIVEPIVKSMRFVEEVASGNFRASLEIDQKDEIGRLAERLVRTVTDLGISEEDSRRKMDLLNRIPSPVLAMDRDYNIVYVNPAGAGIAGKTPEEVIGMKCYDLYKTPHCGTGDCACGLAMRDDRIFTAETVVDPDSLNLPILYTAAPLKDAKGKLIGALKTVVDISKQKRVLRGVGEGVAVLGDVVDDVGGLSTEVNEKAGSIAEQAGSVAAAAEEMSVTMSTVASTAIQSKENISAVATATEEMSSTVAEIAQNSEQARKVATNAVQSVSTASSKVSELGKAAREISKVIETIVEIAEQTKLLALNATIEAARAGEAGKGFAVVASEVKELAKQTNSATEDIRRKIEAIQNSTECTVAEIAAIDSVINEVNEIVATIATAVQEQSVTTRDIAGNVAQAASGVSDMTQNVAQAAEVSQCVSSDIAAVSTNAREVKAAADRLAETGERLRSTGSELTGVVAQLDQT